MNMPENTPESAASLPRATPAEDEGPTLMLALVPRMVISAHEIVRDTVTIEVADHCQR